jgi:hypothetical protein
MITRKSVCYLLRVEFNSSSSGSTWTRTSAISRALSSGSELGCFCDLISDPDSLHLAGMLSDVLSDIQVAPASS